MIAGGGPTHTKKLVFQYGRPYGVEGTGEVKEHDSLTYEPGTSR